MFAVVLTDNARPSTLYDDVPSFLIIFQSPGCGLPRTLRFAWLSLPLRGSRTQCLAVFFYDRYVFLVLCLPFFASMPLPPMAMVVSM